MNKNQSIALVAVIVIVGLFFYFNSAQAPAPQNTQQQSQATLTPPVETTSVAPTPKPVVKTAPVAKNTISYSAGAFTPTTLNVKTGESVKFINNSTLSMWVMSGPDAYHSEYPAFNQEHSVGKGGVYNFTFVTPGTYTYFNKNNPSAKGLIVVAK